MSDDKTLPSLSNPEPDKAYFEAMRDLDSLCDVWRARANARGLSILF